MCSSDLASAFRLFGQPRSSINYESEVGDGTGSSTVMAPLLWIARTFPEAPVSIWETNSEGQEIQQRNHPFLRLLRRPNPYYSGRTLWQSTILDYFVDGNAYWLKIRNRAGRVVEYWWAPQWTVEPKGDEKTFITHYEYQPGTEPQVILPEEDRKSGV